MSHSTSVAEAGLELGVHILRPLLSPLLTPETLGFGGGGEEGGR